MKQNFKVFFVALILGIGISLIYQKYFSDQNILTFAKESTITYFYVGTYNSEEEVKKMALNYANSLIYEDNGLYRLLIGACTNDNCLDLLSSYFNEENINYNKKTIKINNAYIREVQNYELLINTTDKKYYPSIISSILKTLANYLVK